MSEQPQPQSRRVGVFFSGLVLGVILGGGLVAAVFYAGQRKVQAVFEAMEAADLALLAQHPVQIEGRLIRATDLAQALGCDPNGVYPRDVYLVGSAAQDAGRFANAKLRATVAAGDGAGSAEIALPMLTPSKRFAALFVTRWHPPAEIDPNTPLDGITSQFDVVSISYK